MSVLRSEISWGWDNENEGDKLDQGSFWLISSGAFPDCQEPCQSERSRGNSAALGPHPPCPPPGRREGMVKGGDRGEMLPTA